MKPSHLAPTVETTIFHRGHQNRLSNVKRSEEVLVQNIHQNVTNCIQLFENQEGI